MKKFLPNKVYDALKWFLLVVVPASTLLLTTLTTLWNWNIPINAIVGTIDAFALFFGVCLGISTYQYNKAVK